MPSAICLGEILYDCFFDKSTNIDDSINLRCYPGGAPANVSVGLSRLGISTGLIGAIGNDYFGEQIYKFLKNEHVDLTHLQIKDKHPTSLTVVSKISFNLLSIFSFTNSGTLSLYFFTLFVYFGIKIFMKFLAF